VRVSEIVEAVTDQYDVETVEEVKLRRRIAKAVAFYSRYNPYVRVYSFETIAQSASYELPSGCIAVRDCEYWPNGELTLALSSAGDIDLQRTVMRDYIYDLISHRVIETIKRSEHVRHVSGSYTVENRYIVLHPTPAQTGIPVLVKYLAMHELSGDAETFEYSTIPVVDLEIVRDLVIAELVESKRVAAAILPDYSEGLTQVTRSRIPANAANVAAGLRAKCVDKYTGPVAAV